MIGVFASPTFAHQQYRGWSPVWEQNEKCINAKVTQDHGPPDASQTAYGLWTFEMDAEREAEIFQVDCAMRWGRAAGQLALRGVVLKWTPTESNPNKNSVCVDTGWAYNTPSGTSDGKLVVQTLLAANAPCGEGKYTAMVYARHRWEEAWAGDALGLHEYHKLPYNELCDAFPGTCEQ